ncbi:hypothetical protein [Clostridium weizhouense]|uniref:PepSY domain-containing protein n=1 Tax=Clostridium weizhouense TaxID=2859781 RepID=A0ABS7ASV1_9CLOT|nr:hypothetical protein [Clostridium weizhouense]MBW6411744.1 hypothetical protein [Clostridium weizhouense]
MFSKKLTAVLVALGVVASTSALFNEINIKGAFADSVKQNVVYTKDNASVASKDDFDVTGAEEEAYRDKSLEVLKNYFNISVKENENFKFSACVLNEKTLDELKVKEKETIKELYDNKEIAKEEYDERIAFSEKNNDGLKNRVEKLKHGMIQTGWVGVNNENKCYMFDFNENTKEVDSVLVSEGIPKESDVPLKISEEELKNTAEAFIKQHKLGDLENPKCILVKGKRLFYQDENDSSKKVEVGINSFTGKVSSFSVKEYADFEYNRVINEK